VGSGQWAVSSGQWAVNGGSAFVVPPLGGSEPSSSSRLASPVSQARLGLQVSGFKSPFRPPFALKKTHHRPARRASEFEAKNGRLKIPKPTPKGNQVRRWMAGKCSYHPCSYRFSLAARASFPCLKVSKSHGLMVSWSQSPKVSKSHGLKVSRSHGLKVSRSHGLTVSWSQSPKVSWSQSPKVSKSQSPKVPKSPREARSAFTASAH
jgi:hypothetical protein